MKQPKYFTVYGWTTYFDFLHRFANGLVLIPTVGIYRAGNRYFSLSIYFLYRAFSITIIKTKK